MIFFSNFMSNKWIIVDDRDSKWIKRKIMDKKVACKSFHTDNKIYNIYLKLQTISTELSEIILKRKDDYNRQLPNKLNDPESKPKAYWSISKTLCNGEKIPLIPPVSVNRKLISKFKEILIQFKI